MTGQAAPLPGARGELPTLIGRCAAAYKRGDHRTGKRLYEESYAMINATINTVLHKRVPDPDRFGDVAQDTHLRVWRVLERGIVPSIKQLANNCVIDAYRKTPQGNTRYLTRSEVELISNPTPLIQLLAHYDGNEDEIVPDCLMYEESYTEVWTETSENSEAL